MYLTSLTINGFKSFAKKGELTFATPITAIVGPNGSGKSNVAESFRFVLGEQSMKSMRGKKGEDLIWGGSEGVSRGNRASVTVVLDNAQKVFPIDFAEITIERVVHRDGQNQYLLNGSEVRLKDIQELLASANIGATGHHIISQGEADRILSASPRERRDMIEDALGLKIYQFKKQEAERKLEKTLENVAQVESLRREAAPHLRYLEKQMQKIEKSVAIQAALTKKYAEYLKREDVYLAKEQDRLTRARQEPEEKLTTTRAALKEAKEALAATERVDERSGVLEAESVVAAAMRTRQHAEREVGKYEGQLAYLERRRHEVSKRSRDESSVSIPVTAVKELVLALETQALQALTKRDMNILERALTDMVHRLKVFIEKVSKEDVADQSLAQLEAEERQLQEARGTAEAALTDAVVREEEARAALDALSKERATLVTVGREAEREVFRLVAEERACEAVLVALERESAQIERERSEFKEELQEAVALLGRGAAAYYTYQVVDEAGAAVRDDVIVTEDRSVQRGRRLEVEKLKIRLEELGIGATEDVVKEYEDAKARDAFLAHELEDLTLSIEKLRSLITELEVKLDEQFMAGLERIGTEFHRFFTLMFGGGEAGLVRVASKVDEDDETEGSTSSFVPKSIRDGIELSVKLPNKRVKGLEMLSGGERALTSIALIFAMSQVNPPPFIILDETDAALDEANSRRYGDMIEALAKKSQLILITHNRETMSRAGVLYGVTMGSDGVSKLLSVKLDEAVAVAK